MKFNFKKIAPFVATAVMLGATVAAASYPAPFSTSGASIVIGGSAAGSDLVAAVQVANDLITYATPGTTTTVSTAGDAVALEGTGTQLNISAAFTQTLDDSDLALLSDGVYTESLGTNDNEIDYTQELKVDPDGNIKANYQTNSEKENNPADMLVKLPEAKKAYAYTINFQEVLKVDTTSATKASDDVETSSLKMLGKDYTISDVTITAANGKIKKLTLLSGASMVDAKDETPVTMVVGSTTYTVTSDIYSDSSVKLTVSYNGKTETTEKMQGGDTYKLSDGTRIGVKEVFYSSKESKNSSASLYMGAHEVVLEDANEVEIDGTDVDDSLVTFTQNDITNEADLTAIKVESTVTDADVYLAAGEEWEDNIFEAFSLKFAGLTEDSVKDVVDISTSTSTGKIKFTNSAGDEISLPLGASAANVFLGDISASYNATAFLDEDEPLDVLIDGTYTDDHYFIVTTDAAGTAAHLFKIDKVIVNGTAANAYVTVKDDTADVEEEIAVATGTPTSSTLFGNYNIELDWTDNVNDGTLQVDENTTVVGKVLKTNALAVGDAIGTDNVIKLRNKAVLALMTEANPEVKIASEGADKKIDVKAIVSNDTEIKVAGTNVTPTLVAKDDDSKSYTSYNGWGAKLDWNSDNYDLTITSPEDQTVVDAFVMAPGASVSTAAAGGAVGYVVRDVDMTSTDQNKDLIVVGGGCINTVAAKILGSDVPLCGDAATIAANQAVIKAAANPVATVTGKVALLIAGYEAADTTKAATYILNNKAAVDTTTANIKLDTAQSVATIATA